MRGCANRDRLVPDRAGLTIDSMDEHALRVLEFDKVLARLAGLTSFSGGHDLALALRPAAAYPDALERQETLAEAMHLQEMRTPLSLAGAVDVRLALEKAALDGQLDGQEFLAVAATQRTAQRARNALTRLAVSLPRLGALGGRLTDGQHVIDEIGGALDQRGDVVDGASPALSGFSPPRRRRRERRRRRSLILVGLLAVAAGIGLNGSQTARAQESQLELGINATMQSVVAAFNRGDLPALGRLFTDQGFEAEFFQTKSEAASNPEFFGDVIGIRSVRNVTATSTGATANVDFVIGFGISSEVLSFVSQGGIWVVDGSEPGSAEVPADASIVDLKLQEFAFVFEDGALNSGNFGFSAENIGEQDHEIVILQLPGSLGTADLLQRLESGDESFIQGFGFLGILAPGSTGTAALA